MKKPFAENVKGTIIIDRSVYKNILKENLTLTNKLEKAKKTLWLYADRSHWDTNYTDSFCCTDGWEMAQDCLKELEK